MTLARSDWASIRDRLERTQRVAESLGFSPEERSRILQRRAEQLAARVDEQRYTDAEDAVIILRIGADRFALNVLDVIEVVTHPKLAPVPHAPAQVAGLIQVRGEICPIYHLPRLLQLKEASAASPHFVLLLRSPQGDFGVGADDVEDVRWIPRRSRMQGASTRGLAGWTTEDLIPVIMAESLLERGE